jgi:hypothetical protein
MVIICRGAEIAVVSVCGSLVDRALLTQRYGVVEVLWDRYWLLL